MLVYPFVAIFIARFFIYLTDTKAVAVRISTTILLVICALAVIIVGLAYTGVIDVETLGGKLAKREKTLQDIKIFADMFKNPGWLGLFGLTVLIYAIANSVYLLKKKMNIKILMAGFGLMLAINIFMDAYLLSNFKNAYSARPFAEKLSQKYDLKGNIYVTNDLEKYLNLYALNFYLHNNFRNIDKDIPEQGFFVTLQRNADKIAQEYGNKYEFTLLESSDKLNEYKNEILFYKIKRKD
jgi:hypothetical protein